MGELLRLEHISKKFGRQTVLDDVSLSLSAGEIFSLLGPSGCGKTTLLRICAGLELPDRGRVYLDGRDITELPPNERKVCTIFQSYALFPHMTVWDNIAFGLKVAGQDRRTIREEVDRCVELFQLNGQERKRPGQLSGGQRQRVAIARALICKPQLLLLDEPLAALDLKLRQKMLSELDSIHKEVGIAFLYVTHDQQEAMALSDRIAVLHGGIVEQTGTPAELYEAPENSFIASFIGDSNFLNGRITRQEGDDCFLQLPGLPELRVRNGKGLLPGEEAELSIRPERLSLSTVPRSGARLNVFPGEVEENVYLGSSTRYLVRAGETRLAVLRQHGGDPREEACIRRGDKVWLSFSADGACMMKKSPSGPSGGAA